MNREDIEALQRRILPCIESQKDKDGLEAICRMACALADQIGRDVGNLADSDVNRWMQ